MAKAASTTKSGIPTISTDILEQIAGNIEQVVWLRDNNTGEILYVSPSFESVWGRSCESFYANQKVLIESVHPEDRVQVMVARDHSDQKPFTQVYRIIRPDDSLRWISCRAFLVHDDVNSNHYQVNIAQDISKQNQVDLALRKALDRSREQFTLSRRMSLTRKPEAVLKTLMSAQELRPAQRAALLFFNEKTELAVEGAPYPAIKADKAKEFFRKRVKDMGIAPDLLAQILAVLPPGE